MISIFLGRTANDGQSAIFALEDRPYAPERLIQPANVAHVVLAMLNLPPTAEATQVSLRPMQKLQGAVDFR